MRTKARVTSIETLNSGEKFLTVRVPAGVTVPSIFDTSWYVELVTQEQPRLQEQSPWPPPVQPERRGDFT